jgi:hypothetical protein
MPAGTCIKHRPRDHNAGLPKPPESPRMAPWAAFPIRNGHNQKSIMCSASNQTFLDLSRSRSRIPLVGFISVHHPILHRPRPRLPPSHRTRKQILPREHHPQPRKCGRKGHPRRPEVVKGRHHRIAGGNSIGGTGAVHLPLLRTASAFRRLPQSQRPAVPPWAPGWSGSGTGTPQ